jgi:tRNA 2-selenouridine synthase
LLSCKLDPCAFAFTLEGVHRVVILAQQPFDPHPVQIHCAGARLFRQRILRDYVVDLCAEFITVFGENGHALFAERLTQSLANIHKRLGGERFQRLQAIMQDALAEQARSGAVDLHRGWIEGLLREYYDPMYAFQRESKGARIEFAGEQAAVIAYLRERAVVKG